MILNWILKSVECYDNNGFIWPGFCERGNKPSDSIKWRESLGYLSFSKRFLLDGVSCKFCIYFRSVFRVTKWLGPRLVWALHEILSHSFLAFLNLQERQLWPIFQFPSFIVMTVSSSSSSSSSSSLPVGGRKLRKTFLLCCTPCRIVNKHTPLPSNFVSLFPLFLLESKNKHLSPQLDYKTGSTLCLWSGLLFNKVIQSWQSSKHSSGSISIRYAMGGRISL